MAVKEPLTGMNMVFQLKTMFLFPGDLLCTGNRLTKVGGACFARVENKLYIYSGLTVS